MKNDCNKLLMKEEVPNDKHSRVENRDTCSVVKIENDILNNKQYLFDFFGLDHYSWYVIKPIINPFGLIGI